jgi:hypothetical protein
MVLKKSELQNQLRDDAAKGPSTSHHFLYLRQALVIAVEPRPSNRDPVCHASRMELAMSSQTPICRIFLLVVTLSKRLARSERRNWAANLRATRLPAYWQLRVAGSQEQGTDTAGFSGPGFVAVAYQLSMRALPKLIMEWLGVLGLLGLLELQPSWVAIGSSGTSPFRDFS